MLVPNHSSPLLRACTKPPDQPFCTYSPPSQHTCICRSLLIETDMSGQARDLLIVLGVDIGENGIFALEKVVSHAIDAETVPD